MSLLEKTNQIQFDDYEIETQNFNWGNQIGQVRKKHISIQTDQIGYQDQSTSSFVKTKTFTTQTEQIVLDKENQDADPELLLKFVKQNIPKILYNMDDQVDLHVNQMIMDTYQDYSNLESHQFIQTLQHLPNRFMEKENKLEITDISWNSTGIVLAASIGKFDGICDHKGFIYLWNLNSRNLNEENANHIIETSSCIMSLEFHPTKPSILAAGNFNGEVQVWNVQGQEENLIFQTNVDQYFHKESITQLLWLEQKFSKNSEITYNLMSLSADGKILIWNVNYEQQLNDLSQKFPQKGFLLVKKKEGQISNVGGLCISQNSKDVQNFIIGTESGSIYKAMINYSSPEKKQKSLFENSKWKPETLSFMLSIHPKYQPEVKNHVEEFCKNQGIQEITLKNVFDAQPDVRKLYTNPISFAYEPHLGPVFSVQFNPFDRNVFLSVSLDGNIRIYDLLSPKLMAFFDLQNQYLFKAMWSFTRSSVFTATSSYGDVYVFDLKVIKPISTELDQQHQAYCIKYNKSQNDLLAISYSNCQIKLYQIPQYLISFNQLINIQKILESQN